MMNKVLVVFGGDSDEKEISALSATSILENISNDFSARKINLNDLDLNLLDDENRKDFTNYVNSKQYFCVLIVSFFCKMII